MAGRTEVGAPKLDMDNLTQIAALPFEQPPEDRSLGRQGGAVERETSAPVERAGQDAVRGNAGLLPPATLPAAGTGSIGNNNDASTRNNNNGAGNDNRSADNDAPSTACGYKPGSATGEPAVSIEQKGCAASHGRVGASRADVLRKNRRTTALRSALLHFQISEIVDMLKKILILSFLLGVCSGICPGSSFCSWRRVDIMGWR